MLIQLLFLPIVLAAARHKHHNSTSSTSSTSRASSASSPSSAPSTSATTTTTTATTTTTKKDGWSESMETKSLERNVDRDPFGLTKTLGPLPSLPDYPRSRFEPKHQPARKPTNKNVSLPVIARRHDAPSLNMFPGFLDDLMLRSMFDALDDMTNQRMSLLPIEMLDTNPDEAGSLSDDVNRPLNDSSTIKGKGDKKTVNDRHNRMKRCHGHEHSLFPDESFHLPSSENLDLVNTNENTDDRSAPHMEDSMPVLQLRSFRIFSFPNVSQNSLLFRLGMGPRAELPTDLSLKDGELHADESSTVTRLCIGSISQGFWTGIGGIVVFLILCHVTCFLVCLIIKTRMVERKRQVLNI